jgi:hypothetical protein
MDRVADLKRRSVQEDLLGDLRRETFDLHLVHEELEDPTLLHAGGVFPPQRDRDPYAELLVGRDLQEIHMQETAHDRVGLVVADDGHPLSPRRTPGLPFRGGRGDLPLKPEVEQGMFPRLGIQDADQRLAIHDERRGMPVAVKDSRYSSGSPDPARRAFPRLLPDRCR